MWTWANKEKTAVMMTDGDFIHSRSVVDREVAAWLADGNEPKPFADRSTEPSDDAIFAFSHILPGQHIWCYRFDKVGQKIASHTHDFNHHTLLLAGRVRAVIGDQEIVLSKPMQDRAFYPKGIPHELIGMEPNSAIIQIRFNSEPGYDDGKPV